MKEFCKYIHIINFANTLYDNPSGVISEYVNPYIPTYTPEEY